MNRRDEAPRIVDQPEPGYFRMRLVKGGVFVAARIVLDGHLWSAEINGEPQGEPDPDHFAVEAVHRIWTSGTRIDQSEHDYLLSVARWAEQNAPASPPANPRKPINLIAQPPIF